MNEKSSLAPTAASKAPDRPWKESAAALLRYGVIGGTQQAIFLGANLGLISLGLAGWQAVAITYPIQTLLTFFANQRWTFAKRERRPGQLMKYAIVYVGAYPIAIAMIWALESRGVPSWLATLATVAVFAIGVFLTLMLWVFPASRKGGEVR